MQRPKPTFHAARPRKANTAIEYHDTIADAFAARYRSSIGFRERFNVWTDLFTQYVPAGSRVLDLGCGSGIFSAYLGGRGCFVVGIDGSPGMITLCQRHQLTVNERYEQRSLPLANPQAYTPCDVIVASSLLEYLDDMATMLDQVRTMLRPGGLFLVSMPNRRCLWRRIERLTYAWTGYPSYYGHSQHATDVQVFHHQLGQLGFHPVDVRFVSAADPVSRWLKYLLPKPLVNNLFVAVYRKG